MQEERQLFEKKQEQKKRRKFFFEVFLLDLPSHVVWLFKYIKNFLPYKISESSAEQKSSTSDNTERFGGNETTRHALRRVVFVVFVVFVIFASSRIRYRQRGGRRFFDDVWFIIIIIIIIIKSSTFVLGIIERRR